MQYFDSSGEEEKKTGESDETQEGNESLTSINARLEALKKTT